MVPQKLKQRGLVPLNGSLSADTVDCTPEATRVGNKNNYGHGWRTVLNKNANAGLAHIGNLLSIESIERRIG